MDESAVLFTVLWKRVMLESAGATRAIGVTRATCRDEYFIRGIEDWVLVDSVSEIIVALATRLHYCKLPNLA